MHGVPGGLDQRTVRSLQLTNADHCVGTDSRLLEMEARDTLTMVALRATKRESTSHPELEVALAALHQR